MAEDLKKIIEKVNEEFGKGGIEGFLGYCDDNVTWRMVGDKVVKTKAGIREYMSSYSDMEPPNFSVDNLIAEGNVVVCSGNMTMKDKDGNPGSYSYCDVYRFNGNKIAQLDSYVLSTANESEFTRAAAG